MTIMPHPAIANNPTYPQAALSALVDLADRIEPDPRR